MIRIGMLPAGCQLTLGCSPASSASAGQVAGCTRERQSAFLPKRRCVACRTMADAKSITFRPAVPSDAQVVAAIVNRAYRGDATGRGWTSEADFIAGPRIDEAGFLAILAKDASVVLLGLRDGDIVGCVHLEGSEDGVAFLGLPCVRVTEHGSGLRRALG